LQSRRRRYSPGAPHRSPPRLPGSSRCVSACVRARARVCVCVPAPSLKASMPAASDASLLVSCQVIISCRVCHVSYAAGGLALPYDMPWSRNTACRAVPCCASLWRASLWRAYVAAGDVLPPARRTHHTDGQVGLSRRRHPGLSAAFQRITAPPHPASESAHAEAAMQSRSHAATQPCLVLKMCKLSVRKRVCMISSIVANRSWCSPLSCKTHAPVRAQHRETLTANPLPHTHPTPYGRPGWCCICTHAVYARTQSS
jgi:hypothetical protein